MIGLQANAERAVFMIIHPYFFYAQFLRAEKQAVQKQLVFYGRTVQGGERTLISLGWGKVLYAGAVPVDSDGQLLRSRLIDLCEDAGILQSQEICMHAGMTAYTDKRFFSYGPEKVLDVRLPERSVS